MDDYTWVHDVAAVDLEELSRLYRIAPLGDKPPEALAAVFGNSMFTCFVYASGVLAGAGRVLADGPHRGSAYGTDGDRGKARPAQAARSPAEVPYRARSGSNFRLFAAAARLSSPRPAGRSGKTS